MASDGRNSLAPLLEGAELPVLPDESLRHLCSHCVGLEYGEHLVGVADAAQEAFLVGRWVYALGEPLHSPRIHNAQHLPPRCWLDVVRDIKPVVYLV